MGKKFSKNPSDDIKSQTMSEELNPGTYTSTMTHEITWFTKTKVNDATLALLPLLAFFGQYLVRSISGARFDASYMGNSSLINFLSASVLRANPIEAIWGLHTQPPLLNGIFALAFQFYPHEKIIVEILWMIAGLGLVYCVYFFSLELTKLKTISALIAVTFQLVPSTVGYIFHAYNTILIQFLFSLMMLGIIKVLNEKKIGILISDIALLLLFLGRAPFVSFLVLMGMVATRLYFYRKGNSRRILYKSSIAIMMPIVIIIQGHFLLDFKQIPLSSWGGNSTLRAIVNGVGTEELARQIGNDPCRLEILGKQYQGQVITEFPSCLEKYSKIKVRTTEKATQGNKNNSAEALQASMAAQDLVKYLLPRNLDALPKILLGNIEKLGTIEYFLGLAKFPLVSVASLKENLNFLLSLILSLFYLIVLFRRAMPKVDFQLVLISWTLMSYILFYSLFTEILENDRYKVEGNVVYFLISVTIFWQLFGTKFRESILRNLEDKT